MEWRLSGKLHRVQGPAVEYADGTKEWWVKGELHRADGPAIERAGGQEEWWLNDKLHRTDGPAAERADGGKQWWVKGVLNRTDGPAIEDADGTKEWWVKGEGISEPYSHVLTAAFTRGLPIPPKVLPEMLKATRRAQTNGEQIGSLKTILHKYWPTQVKKILAALFSSTDPAIKNLAFSLLGREVQPDSTSKSVRPWSDKRCYCTIL